MTTKLTVLKDINGNVFYAIPFSDHAYNTTLAEGTAQTIPVPGDAVIAIFTWTSGTDIFVSTTGTATLPEGSVALTASYMNPITRPVSGVTNLSIITPNTQAYIEVSFYTLLLPGIQ